MTGVRKLPKVGRIRNLYRLHSQGTMRGGRCCGQQLGMRSPKRKTAETRRTQMSKLTQPRPVLAIAAAGAALAGALAVAGTASAAPHSGTPHLAVRAKLAGPDHARHVLGLRVGKRRGRLNATTFYNW